MQKVIRFIRATGQVIFWLAVTGLGIVALCNDDPSPIWINYAAGAILAIGYVVRRWWKSRQPRHHFYLGRGGTLSCVR